MEDLINSVTGHIGSTVEQKYANFILEAPYILGAITIFILGLILAEIGSRALLSMSQKLKLELLSDKLGLKHFLTHAGVKQTPSEVIAKSFKAYLIFLFFIEATKIARLTEVADFLTTVISYVPDLIIALFIILVGIRIGNTLQLIVSTSLSFARTNTANAMGVAAKSTVVAFAALAALSQLQIAEILIQILFIGFVSMLTIAGGLAIGLGGKDLVKEVLEAFKNMELIEIMEDRKREKTNKSAEEEIAK